MEAGALAGRGFEANGAAVIVNNFGDDGEAEAYTFFFRGEEWIEDLLAGFGRDAGTGVFDNDRDAWPHVLRFGSDGDAETAVAIHGLVCVGDEVDEDLLAELGIDLDIWRCWIVVALDCDLRIWMLMLDRFENVIDDGRQLHGAQFEARRPGEIEESGDERIETIHFRADVTCKLAGEWVRGFDFLAEHFSGAFDNTERIANFVSEACGELS